MNPYLCPKDLRPCCDDLCRGGGCLITGEELYYFCTGCKHPISDEDQGNCICEPDEDWINT
jgi:hypothetical protein